jgi:superfamily II DNA/RNA helicase
VNDTFGNLGAAPFFVKRLGERNIFKPTEIQRQVIPRLFGGKNTLFRSATGTGKTFAYLIPFLQRLLEDPPANGNTGGPGLLVAAPTFELCAQIKEEADFLLKAAAGPDGAGAGKEAGADSEVNAVVNAQPRVSLLIGSANLSRQIEALKREKPLVVVGNPGRLHLLARMGKLKLRAVRFLALDEWDRLISPETLEETSSLIGLLSRGPGLLWTACSATLQGKNREQLLALMEEDCETVETEEQEILRERIVHWAIFSERRRKIDTLRSFLSAARPKKALVFSGGGGQPGIILSRLRYARIPSAGLWGDMDRKTRKDAIDGFRSGKYPVLVSSDLAARGLDIPGITHVIALDVPADGEAYIHRAGRTGRAGKRGLMVSIGDAEEMRRLASLEKKLGLVVYPKELYGGTVCGAGDPDSATRHAVDSSFKT